MDDMLLWGIVEALLQDRTRWYRGLDCNTGEPQIGCPGLALLTAGIGTGSQCHTEVVIELAAVRYTLNGTYTEGFVVASGNLVSTLDGTEVARRGFGALGTAGLAHIRSFPARVGSSDLQTKGQMRKAEWLTVALPGNDQSHLHAAHLVGPGYSAR